MIRTIYAVCSFSEIKCICEAKEDAEKMADICGEHASVSVVPFFPAYGYVKLGCGEDE